MNLTKHFTLEEMNKRNCDLVPSVVNNLQQLAVFLEHVRTIFGHPILVTSGFRSAALNKEVGGKPNSMHLLGKAVDITCHSSLDFDRLCFCVQRAKYVPGSYIEIHQKKRYIHIHFGSRDNEPLNLLPFVPFTCD